MGWKAASAGGDIGTGTDPLMIQIHFAPVSTGNQRAKISARPMDLGRTTLLRRLTRSVSIPRGGRPRRQDR